jgi:predicted ATPase/DNA-binding CsgD family transcriptional regulator
VTRLSASPAGERRHNLPVQLTSFVGREWEVAEVRRLLGTTRLLTLVGAGGIGKTRLAQEVAAGLLDAYPDGVRLVELAALVDPRSALVPALVPQAIASALGVREQPGRPLSESLAEFLAPRSLLLVLDNCEHLIQACAELADRLLRACPRLTILATSREPLGIAGETTWRVPSLALPDAERPPATDDLGRYEAIRLFVERARAALPDFRLTDRNARAVAQVCQRLDGIPLALELAAARVRGLSVEQLAAGLDDRFRLLTGGSRTALPRHRTLRALVDWSYEPLSEPERALFRRLAVFAGGWTLEAAEAVCAGDGTGALRGIEAGEVVGLLLELVDKSLVVAEDREGEARYRFLETIRQYGLERLEASGEAAEIRRRHAEYFVTLAERAEPELSGPGQAVWLDRLEREHDNLRATLGRLSRPDPGEVARGGSRAGAEAQARLRLGGALGRFWDLRGYLAEGRAWLAALLGPEGAAPPTAARSRALCAAGWLAYWQGDYAAARALSEESVSIGRQVGDERGVAEALTCLGWIADAEGDHAAARTLFEASLAIRRRLGDRWGIAQSLSGLGWIASVEGDHAAARTLLDESLAVSREVGDKRGIADALVHLADLLQAQGELAQARGFLDESLAIGRDLGDRAMIVEGLELSAKAALTAREAHRAARLLGAVHALREVVGAPVSPSYRAEQERDVVAVRADLGEGRFAAAWAAGRAMTLAQAVAYALEGRTPELALPAPPGFTEPSGCTQASPLTRREQEVAVLIARGLTNRQIAETLVIAERTVHAHVGNILGKLGFSSRAQIAAWVVEQGLPNAAVGR